jgi:hypothetical protein
MFIPLHLQDQDCPGGCFSPSNSYNGDLAVLRIWDRVLSADDIKRNMMRERPDSEAGLVGLYIFDAEGAKATAAGEPVATDRSGECSAGSRVTGLIGLQRGEMVAGAAGTAIAAVMC